MILIYIWRRERDSNPRYGFPYTRVESRHLQENTDAGGGGRIRTHGIRHLSIVIDSAPQIHAPTADSDEASRCAGQTRVAQSERHFSRLLVEGINRAAQLPIGHRGRVAAARSRRGDGETSPCDGLIGAPVRDRSLDDDKAQTFGVEALAPPLGEIVGRRAARGEQDRDAGMTNHRCRAHVIGKTREIRNEAVRLVPYTDQQDFPGRARPAPLFLLAR